jgi:hypothetical protein
MGKKFKNIAAKLSQVNDFWDRPEARGRKPID